MENVFEIFEKIRNLKFDCDGLMTVEEIPGVLEHKIGVSENGLPVFFIKTKDKTGTANDINLNLIKVEYQKSCELIINGGEKSVGIYSIVYLKSTSEDMIKYFINTVFYLISQLDFNPSFIQIKEELSNLINLFRGLSRPALKTIQGLWSELLIIEQGIDLPFLINSWHQNINERYDFNDGKDKIEVKSTSRSSRIHSFSLEQLTELNNGLVLVASIFCIETGNGVSVEELMKKIEKKVKSPELMFKINKIVAETMGVDIERIYDTYFDYSVALNSICYYDVKDIPKIDVKFVPMEISNIKFDSNLTNVAVYNNSNVSKLTNAIFY